MRVEVPVLGRMSWRKAARGSTAGDRVSGEEQLELRALEPPPGQEQPEIRAGNSGDCS